MNIDFGKFLDEGFSRDEIIAALDEELDKRSAARRKEEIEEERENLIYAVMDYLTVLDPSLVDFKDTAERLKWVKDFSAQLIPFEEIILNKGKTITRVKTTDPDKIIYNFLKGKDLA